MRGCGRDLAKSQMLPVPTPSPTPHRVPLLGSRWQHARVGLSLVGLPERESPETSETASFSETPSIRLTAQPFTSIMQRSAVTAQMLGLICFRGAHPAGGNLAQFLVTCQWGAVVGRVLPGKVPGGGGA